MTTPTASHASKDAILALARSTKIERVEIDGLDAPIFVRGLSARERDAFEASCMAGKGKARGLNMDNVRARLLVRSICDANGERVFADHEADALGAVPAAVIDRLFTIAQQLSGLSPTDVDDLAGN
jgi:hypothetical protein